MAAPEVLDQFNAVQLDSFGESLAAGVSAGGVRLRGWTFW